MSRSLMSRVAEGYLRLMRTKSWASDPRKTTARLQERARLNEEPYALPTRLKARSSFTIADRDGMQVVTVRGARPAAQILYLHGGAYINQPSIEQWRFVDSVVQGTGMTVTAPVYPKAPVHHVNEALASVLRLWLELRQQGPVVLLGDSAGGGLALALTLHLRDGGLPMPDSLVLLSPWVDAEMGHPGIPALESSDPMLSAHGLVEAGKAWAGGLSLSDPRVSPLNGDLRGLPPTTLFVGTREIFLPDVRAFRDKARAAGVVVDYHEGVGMNHDYPLFPIPEARAAVATITRTLQPTSV